MTSTEVSQVVPVEESSRSATLVRRSLLIILVAAGVVAALRFIPGPVGPQDEGLLLEYPLLVGRGLLPVKDFHAVYPAGWFLGLHLIYSIFGLSMTTERLAGIALVVLMGAAVWQLGRHEPDWRVAALGTSTLFAMPSLAASAWSASVAFALAGIAILAGARSKWRAMLGAIVLAYAASSRLDFLVSVGIAVAILFRFREVPAASRGPLRWGMGIGLLIGLSPLFVNFAALGPRGTLTGFVVDQARIRSGRYLPIGLAVDPMLFVLVALLCVVSLIGFIRGAVFHAGWNASPAALAWAMFIPVAVLQFVQRNDNWHAYSALLVLGPFGILSAVDLARSQRDRVPRVDLRVLAGTATLLSLVLAAPTLQATARGLLQSAESRKACGAHYCVLVSPKDADPIQQLVAVLRTMGVRKVFVGPSDLRTANYNDLFLYTVLAPAEPCTYYLEMNPLAANGPKSKLSSQLPACDALVLTDRYVGWNEANASRHLGPNTPNEVVANRFRQVATMGRWTVYENLARLRS